MFVDRVEITVTAGVGGAGCISFRREKYIPRGGPDGGDGGNGGNIILKAREKVPALASIRHKSTHKAETGTAGGGGRKTGKAGKDCIIQVPLGTMAWDLDTSEFLGELLEHGDKITVAKGGKGGDGNVKFATPMNRVPQHCGPGTPGQERSLILEFAIPADTALLGLPNSGKSTIAQALTNTRSLIAEYEFTTREPHIGVCEVSPFARFTILDLPALCDGSSEGQGLGNWFLRHLHRPPIVLLILDPTSSASFSEQIDILHKETAAADSDLAEKQLFAVVNLKKKLTKKQKEDLAKLNIPTYTINPNDPKSVKNLSDTISELTDIN